MATKKKQKLPNNIFFVVNEFPQDTKEIYICGSCKELGEWNCEKAVKMIANEKGEFEYNLHIKGVKSVEYKYLADKKWDNVECGDVAFDIENRSFMNNGDKYITDQIKKFRN